MKSFTEVNTPIFFYFDQHLNVTVHFYKPSPTAEELCFREFKQDDSGSKISVRCGTTGEHFRIAEQKYPGFCHFYNMHNPFENLPEAMKQAAFELFVSHCFEVYCDEIICDEIKCDYDIPTNRKCHQDAHMLRLLLLQMMLETPGVFAEPKSLEAIHFALPKIRNNFWRGIKTYYTDEIDRTVSILDDESLAFTDTERNALIKWEQEMLRGYNAAVTNFNYSLGRLCYMLNLYYPMGKQTSFWLSFHDEWCHDYNVAFDPTAKFSLVKP